MAFKDVLDLVEVAFHPNCKKNTQPMYFAAFYSTMTFMIDMKTVSKWILEEFLLVDYLSSKKCFSTLKCRWTFEKF